MSEWTISVEDMGRPIALYRAVSAFLRKTAEVNKYSCGSDEEYLNGAAAVLDSLADDAEKLRKAMLELQAATTAIEGKC